MKQVTGLEHGQNMRPIYINYENTLYYSIHNNRIQVKVNFPGAKWRDSLFTVDDFYRCVDFKLIKPVGLELL